MKQFRILFQFLMFTATVATAQSSFGAGFKNGNELEAIRISGYVTALCPNPNGIGTDIQTYSCRGELLNPSEADYFVGPNVDADKVVLTATRADGSKKEKNSAYRGDTGISNSRFNLWIRTLTQRPLLDIGQNAIHYSLQKGGTPVTEGDFIANVKRAPDATCQRDTINFPFATDCQNVLRICDRYFQQNNYCQ